MCLQDGHFSNLVPRPTFLPRCPSGAWSGNLFSLRGLGRLLLGSVTARKVAYFAVVCSLPWPLSGSEKRDVLIL